MSRVSRKEAKDIAHVQECHLLRSIYFLKLYNIVWVLITGLMSSMLIVTLWQVFVYFRCRNHTQKQGGSHGGTFDSYNHRLPMKQKGQGQILASFDMLDIAGSSEPERHGLTDTF